MKAHRTDLVSLVFALLFLGLAAWWLAAQLLGLALPPVGWFLAGGLILVGVLGLVGALRAGRDDRKATAGQGTPDTAPGATDVDAAVTGPGADAPTTGAGPVPADEWPTAAVADTGTAAAEDRPLGDGYDPARWSPADPLDDDPATPGGRSPAGPERADG
ncbi:hypothetical protein GCM10010429_21800 [Micromonospora olivasterospora]|uniref:Uncharacterized protein n=1 Tax=Micromonospora olivasterospora TaxID=1880 RepID=A0A562I768_MICOL|nr:hypothetical protein [Micromonospora olivasterospora]TWH66514.1 hypothetical protein JD77_01468 [Micromonospora olivasterospora]